MKNLCLALLVSLCLFPLGAAEEEPLTADDLHGRWVLAEDALSKDEKDAAEAAKQIEGYSALFTLRTARLTLQADGMVAGMWRLDNATATSATLVVYPRGRAERSYQLTLKDDILRIAEAGKLPLKKAQ